MMPEPQTPVTPMFAVASAKPGSSDQRSQPITLKRGSSVVAVDAHALDRAGRRALAAGNLRALEGRAGRRRAGEQALAVAEHDFGVGADIDDEPQLVAEIGRLGEHDAGRVGADMAGDAGQRIDEGAGRDVEAEIARPRLVGAVDRQREGRAAELGRIEAEDEMMHDRIADQRRFEDLAARDAGLRPPLRRSARSIASRTARVSSASPPGFIIT